MADDQELDKKLDDLQKNLEKKHGKGVVTRASQLGQHVLSTPRWDLDSPVLSYIMGGGLPKGRMIELFGAESGGKTSLALYMGAQIQKQGGVVAYIDAEHAADFSYAQIFGLDTDSTYYVRPDSGEVALDVVYDLADSGVVDYIIIDSVAALVPSTENEGDMGDQQMGLQARLIAKGCRKLSSILSKNNVTVVWINQIREKIGVMFGNPETTPGGRSLKYYASLRLDIRRTDYIPSSTKKDEFIGIKTRLKAVKSKVSPPMRKGELVLHFDSGFQTLKEYVDFAVQYGIVQKSGSWYTLLDENGGKIEKLQGDANVQKFLQENPEYAVSLKERVQNAMQSLSQEEPVQEEPEKDEGEEHNENPSHNEAAVEDE